MGLFARGSHHAKRYGIRDKTRWKNEQGRFPEGRRAKQQSARWEDEARITPAYAVLESLVKGGAWICIGSGPSLTQEDCERVRESGLPTIVVNTTYQLCPWAHILYAMDAHWWREYLDDVRQVFQGRLVSTFKNDKGIDRLHFQYGRNSGFGAINLAKKLGAKTVILLGYDCDRGPNGETHHHGDHPPHLRNAHRVNQWLGDFRSIQSQRIRVINCSRHTRIPYFNRMSLEDALCELS